MRLLLIAYTFIFLSFGLPLAAQLDFTWDVNEGCVPLRVKFAVDTSNFSLLATDVAEWTFGSDPAVTAGALDTVEHVIRSTSGGTIINVSITGSNPGSITKQYYGGRDPLIADFNYQRIMNDPDYTYSFTPTVDTDVGSTYTYSWEHVSGSDSSILRSVPFSNTPEKYTYADTGFYVVRMGVREVNPTYTCLARKEIVVEVLDEFIMPNVFAPESMGYFIVDPEDNKVTLSFKVFTRTGILVFDQEAPVIYWDGKNFTGQKLQTAVYYYVIEATKGDTKNRYSKQGFIHVFQ